MQRSLEGQNIIVLDLETLHSADDCRYCGQPLSRHYDSGACEPWSGHKPPDSVQQWNSIGWDNKVALGLSIGCYFDYQDGEYHWFDMHTLEATMRDFVERQPLLVSFNGVTFDFALMRALLRHDVTPSYGTSGLTGVEHVALLGRLCDLFKLLCATSYDILRAIWEVDPDRKFEKGLNSLGAISVANGFGEKAMDGATAPRLWVQGRYAEVLNYCQGDVRKTKQLFERIVIRGSILRGDGFPLTLALPQGLQPYLFPKASAIL